MGGWFGGWEHTAAHSNRIFFSSAHLPGAVEGDKTVAQRIVQLEGKRELPAFYAVIQSRHESTKAGVGGWVGGWMMSYCMYWKIEEDVAVRMSCCRLGIGWAGGWVALLPCL